MEVIKNYIDKEQFYNQAKVFFEEGLLKEIYSSDKISICNVCNACYMVFNYTITKSGPIGVVLETKYIKSLMENDNLFNEIRNVLGGEKFRDNCSFLNRDVYEYLKEVKAQTDLKGPYIDLEYEKSLTGNLKSR